MSDGEIRKAIEEGEIEVTGHPGIHVGSSSIDLHLHNSSKVMKRGEAIHLKKEYQDDLFESNNDWEEVTIYPGEFYVMSTKERIKFADNIVGFVQGRSSLARLGIQVHCAGFADAGFDGTITLEVTNLSPRAITIPKDTRICQVVFDKMKKPAEIPYGKNKNSKYQGQSGPTVTRISNDYK